ncbi:MAG: YdcF family protein [Oscillospiraceae bacterium]|nr:YdcF family protein [Oscillospiraceae bacterium]
MKFLKTICLLLLVAGIAFCLLPYHMEFTGYVLILVGAGLRICLWLFTKGLKLLFGLLLGAVILGTVWLTGSMTVIGLYGSFDATLPQSEYAVVLGAEVQGDIPSVRLQERLDRTLKFMEEYPNTVIILSGGQGEGENLPESHAMYLYLEAHGADMSRVYEESKSRNTRENLMFSGDLAEKLGLDRKKVTIITSDFHLLRAEYIASSLGMEAGSVGALTKDVFFRLNYYVRETFAFVKAIVQKTIAS